MKFKSVFNLLFISLICITIVPTLLLADGDTILPAFFISKDKNKNIVKYDLRLKNNCSINTDEPFDIYWMTFGNDQKYFRENMNFIERHYYGVEIDQVNSQELKGNVKILKKMNLAFPMTVKAKQVSGKCVVETIIQTDKVGDVILKNILLQKFNGQKPNELIILGKGVSKNNEINYLVDLKKISHNDD